MGVAMTELTTDQALEKGVEAYKAGQAQEANRLYTAILKAQPKHPDANHNMGVLAVGVGKVLDALPFFKTALEGNPSAVQFWLSYIDALIKLEKLTDAKVLLDQAKSNGVEGGNFDKLERRLLQTDQGSPSPSQNSFLNTASHLRESGKLGQAIDLLTDGITQFPKDADMLALLSHCYILNDDLEEATLYLAKAKSIDPNNASVGWNKVRLLLKNKSMAEAVAIARNTNKRFPDDVEGMGVLGSCLRATKEISESIVYLDKAIELNPNYAEALINRGLIYLTKENKVKALADLETAHKLKPHIKQIWDLVINLKIELKEFSEAIILIKRISEIDSTNERNFASMAFCYQNLADFGLAIEAYKKAIAIKPDYVEAYVNLGSALKKQDKLEEAVEFYKKALSFKPDCAEAYFNMAVTFEEQFKLEEAIEAYKKALSIKPDYAMASSNMGRCLLKYGRFEEGRSLIQKADGTISL